MEWVALCFWGHFLSKASCSLWVNEVQSWPHLSLAEDLLQGLAHEVPTFPDVACYMVEKGSMCLCKCCMRGTVCVYARVRVCARAQCIAAGRVCLSLQKHVGGHVCIRGLRGGGKGCECSAGQPKEQRRWEVGEGWSEQRKECRPSRNVYKGSSSNGLPSTRLCSLIP